MVSKKLIKLGVLSFFMILSQRAVYAEAPALWFGIFNNTSYTGSLSACLNYGETLLTNLQISNVQRQTYAVLGNRGESKIVIACNGSNVATVMVSSNDVTESECVINTFWSLMDTGNAGSGSTINCTLNPATTGGTPATIAQNLNIHIPNAAYQPAFGNPMNLWADLQFMPGADGSLIWRLSNYGLNQ